MHSVTIILKTRRTKAELHIENGKFSTPKVLAARPNLWEWWVGEKIAVTTM